MNVELPAILETTLQLAVMLLLAVVGWCSVQRDRRRGMRMALVRATTRRHDAGGRWGTSVLARSGPTVAGRHTGPPVFPPDPGFSLDPTPPDGSRPGQVD